jgi:hypothetical protein
MSWQRTMVFCLAIGCATVAEGALRHRYSFSGDATDSVGGAHGTVVVNTGQGSNSGISEDAYVNLPNGIISAAASGGALTTEIWARSAENRNWAALFSAGSSNGGEDSSSGGNGTDYIQLIPRAGAAENDLRQTTHRANVGAEGFVDDVTGGDLSTTVERHIVSVFDQTGGLPGTVTMYVDGVLIGSAPIAGNAGPEGYLNLAAMNDNNNWLGRSQWPDPIFDGFINEFRIHDSALTPAHVLASFVAGPDVVIPEPASAALLLASLGGVAAIRRRRA